MERELYIVTGATGRLGAAFAEELLKTGQNVIGLSRKSAGNADFKIVGADLLDENSTSEAVGQMDLQRYSKLIVIHAVGKFKFEKHANDITDKDQDGIDDEVYRTNVVTLENLLRAFFQKDKICNEITICTFASVSDRYNIPFWNSYTKAKNFLRKYLEELAAAGKARALMVNVSTIDTGNENLLRPHADKTYWLRPEDVASKTLAEIKTDFTYKEIDIIKENPEFTENYYRDHEAILKKWQKEMDAENTKP